MERKDGGISMTGGRKGFLGKGPWERRAEDLEVFRPFEGMNQLAIDMRVQSGACCSVFGRQ